MNILNILNAIQWFLKLLIISFFSTLLFILLFYGLTLIFQLILIGIFGPSDLITILSVMGTSFTLSFMIYGSFRI